MCVQLLHLQKSYQHSPPDLMVRSAQSRSFVAHQAQRSIEHGIGIRITVSSLPRKTSRCNLKSSTNDELPPAWIDGTAAVLSVTKEEVAKANKIDDAVWFNSTVELDEDFGGGYMATIDLFHQLHCLVCCPHQKSAALS